MRYHVLGNAVCDLGYHGCGSHGNGAVLIVSGRRCDVIGTGQRGGSEMRSRLLGRCDESELLLLRHDDGLVRMNGLDLERRRRY